METVFYRLGRACIEIHMPEEMPRPENMAKFQIAEGKESELQNAIYTLEFTDVLSDVEAGLRKRKTDAREIVREALRIFYTETGECRLISYPGGEHPYAVSCQETENQFHVWIDRTFEKLMTSDTIFASLLSLERQMMKNGDMIFHSAYMCLDGEAVLFSAPSETGKSTQASLWEKYRGTRTINGDRSLLMRQDDGWYAGGWTVCGNSGICHNESYPIRAIVMLKQAKENRAYPLKGFQAVRELMEQITVNTWNSEFQMKVMDNLELLLQEVQVFRLECDISEAAVECLERVLDAIEVNIVRM